MFLVSSLLESTLLSLIAENHPLESPKGERKNVYTSKIGRHQLPLNAVSVLLL